MSARMALALRLFRMRHNAAGVIVHEYDSGSLRDDGTSQCSKYLAAGP